MKVETAKNAPIAAVFERGAANAAQRELLELLDRRPLTVGMRASVTSALEHLRAHPQNKLARSALGRFERWHARFASGDASGEPWEPIGWVERGEERRTKHFAKPEPLTPPRPAWMDNPALLPKRPPGRT